MKDNKKVSREAFDMQAATYDTDKNGKHARTLYPHIREKLLQMSFDSLLDVGCGTGEMLNTVKNIRPAAMFCGIDISSEMLKKAQEKLQDAAELSLGDAEHLPYENGSFDLLMCADSFHHYPDPQKAIAEFYRVLKPEGQLLLADYWRPLPVRCLMNLFISFSKEGDVKVYSEKEIRNFLRQVGFCNIEYRNVNDSAYLVTAKK